MAKARKPKQAPEPPTPQLIRPRNERLMLVMAAFALVMACILIYAQTASHDFVRLDDTPYIHDNPNVRTGLTGANIHWAFTTASYFYWQPLTWISHMIDVQLFGLRAGPHHLVNVAWHCANTVLLLIALWRLTGSLWRSAIAAALFALHPLRVESVAWIAERKDVLSGFFWMLTLLGWSWYARRPSTLRLYAVTGIFALGLMSKPSVVTLPFVLVLLDYWPLRRFRDFDGMKRMLLEKAPMLWLAAIVSFITFVGQRQMGAVISLDSLPLYFRVYNGLLSYARYLGKMIWPSDLAVLYPFDKMSIPALIGSVLLLALITTFVWLRRRDNPYLIVGWLWFLGAMVPMLGLAQTGNQAMADRFTYLPMIGIAIAVSWGLGALALRHHVPLLARAALIGFTLGVLTLRSLAQTSIWKDSLTLFEHTIAVTKDNDIMMINVASIKMQAGDFDRALALYEEVVRIDPKKTPVQIEAGALCVRKGQYERARRHFEAALRQAPNDPKAMRGIADVLLGEGKKEEARRQLQQLLSVWPNDVEARARLLMIQ